MSSLLMWPLRALIALGLSLTPAGAAPRLAPDVLSFEADRLVEAARARGGEAGGAVELIRLHALARWQPPMRVESALVAAGRDTRRHPLVQAVAWWLARDLALARLDATAAEAAADALGLIRNFSLRPGPAPSPLDPINLDEWRTYPPEVGRGVIQLDAVVRPSRDHVATVVTELSGPSGPAVLRLGFDDEATVWLNGDEIYTAPDPHRAWLDQAIIPLALTGHRDRLMIQVKQTDGAWRLMARLTDPEGRPLRMHTSATPVGPPPPPAKEIEAPYEDDIDWLWRDLAAASKLDEPPAQALRDLADYARVSGMPTLDQTMPRIAVEAAWLDDPSPRSLRAWMLLLPEGQRASTRQGHKAPRPLVTADVLAELSNRLDEGWDHYYGGRNGEAMRVADALLADAPGHLPAVRLKAVVLEDLGLPQLAVAQVKAALANHADIPSLRKALVSTLLAAGRHREAMAETRALLTDGVAGADDLFRLAEARHKAGRPAQAVALLDQVTAARPSLWFHALEAAEILEAAGDFDGARARMTALSQMLPESATVLRALADVHEKAGDLKAARAALEAAARADPDDEQLARRLAANGGKAKIPPLGPSLDEVLKTQTPEGTSAHVLYHHARTEVQPNGLATRRLRRVVRITDDVGARRFANWELTYVPGRQRLEVEVARLYRAGAPPASPRRSDQDLSEPEYRLYYDLRAEVLTFDTPKAGDVIEVAWRLTDLEGDPAFPGYYGELAWLQEAVPRAKSIVEIAGPAAEALQVEVIDQGLPVRKEGLTFTATDVPAAPWESSMPGASSVRAHIHLSTAQSWAEIDQRYRALLGTRDTPDATLTALAQKWAGDAATPEEQAARLYERVAGRTRYVGLELGLHSFQPELPRVTLARGYGDCKDKATLLIALARALGIEAHLALVRTRSAGAISASPASLAVFNHAMVWFPGLGRFMDPTVDRNDPWTLPPDDQLATTFVVGVDKAPRIVPAQEAAHNLTRWRLDLTLDRKGGAQGEARWLTRGHAGTVARRALEAEGARAEVMARALEGRFPGVKVTTPSAGGLNPAFDPVEASAQITLPPLRQGADAGELALPLGGGGWALVSQYADAAQRQSPLLLAFKHRLEQSIRLKLPRGARAEVPDPIDLNGPFGRFTALGRYDAHTRTVTVEVSLEVSTMAIQPADYPAFRAWMGEIDQALVLPVIIERKGAG